MSTYRPDAGNPDSGLKKWFVDAGLVPSSVSSAPVKFVKGVVPDGYESMASVNYAGMPDFTTAQAKSFLERAKARPEVVDAPSSESVFKAPLAVATTEAFSMW